MGFVKLDVSIMDSSVWVDRNVRDVFITCLLMAQPRVFDEPIEQISVRSLELTGYAAPPGRYGFIAASSTGIATRSLVSFEETLVALETLGAPDHDSRSQDFEGRRIIRVDGGYVVLNFAKWRDKDITGSERVRKWREKQNCNAGNACNAVTPPLHNADVTEAEAEAEADKLFERFWDSYPKRAGGNPKAPALKAFVARCREGVRPDGLIAAAGAYRRFCEATGKVGGEYVKQAQFWLSPNFRGWEQDWKPPNGLSTNSPPSTPDYPSLE